MNNRKSFFIIGASLLASLLFTSEASSTGNVSNHTYFKPRLYISGQYRPGVSHFSKFSVKETNYNTTQLVGLKKDISVIGNSNITTYTNFNFPYIAEFQDNAISFSGAIGYLYSENFRIEVEASYEEFDVKNPEGSATDAYRYFALARAMDGTNKSSPDDTRKFTVMRNDGLSISSVMINGCYNFTLDDIPVVPYVCAGIGGDFIEFFNDLHVKFAHQGKVGISYSISPEVSLFLNGYYHKVTGNRFKNLHVQHVSDLSDAPKFTSAVATLNVGYFGGEIGVRFIF
ncbi:major outer membrane protein OMP-1Y [Ehrlichia chaffeensis str. Arkansas]|uniref:Major outer membrane protein OMP-1Y n=2 Tax=Ehrlichia chaffeensis TaxID=945 RepID=Q2GF68_EHRCR|nr:P44/Msp2 family outer membrane protein [Ehrlichia chaffeensis]AAF73418.1 P29-9 [Ehrlichia chaffeensis]AAK28669.1 major outer membrane protein OMP-1Y [Ehrlichia chaffeensis]ABD45283.1 major outer membrane protein OMP-1Y [Ehrlichia chaffeensis str. Arkansas]AHX07672.1 outer membrane beta-barrel domain protein [Ehrlichia chaffeensis str. Osceola]